MNPCTDERLMMRPRPRARMCGRTSFTMRMTPKTLMSKTPWACATEVSSAAPIEPMPALLTRTSPPEPLDHLLDRGGDRLVTGHIEVDERHTVERGDARGVAACAGHVETRCDQCERGVPADAG